MLYAVINPDFFEINPNMFYYVINFKYFANVNNLTNNLTVWFISIYFT